MAMPAALCRTQTWGWKGDWDWNSSTSWAPYPRALLGIGPGPSEWPQSGSHLREAGLSLAHLPKNRVTPGGFPTHTPGIPFTCLLPDLSLMESFQFFLLNQLLLQLPSSSGYLLLYKAMEKEKPQLRKGITKSHHCPLPSQCMTPSHHWPSSITTSSRTFYRVDNGLHLYCVKYECRYPQVHWNWAVNKKLKLKFDLTSSSLAPSAAALSLLF